MMLKLSIAALPATDDFAPVTLLAFAASATRFFSSSVGFSFVISIFLNGACEMWVATVLPLEDLRVPLVMPDATVAWSRDLSPPRLYFTGALV